MKLIKIILLTVSICSFFNIFSQEQKNLELSLNLTEKDFQKDLSQKIHKEAVEVFRDRLIMDVFHSFWMNTPTNVKPKFNPGFNVAILWDFKTTKKSPISFGLGIGCTFHTQFSNAELQYSQTEKLTKYFLFPQTFEDKDSLKLSRMTFINANIPLEFRYRHKNGFKFTVGVRLGLVAELAQRYKGKNLEGKGFDENYKIFLKNDRQNFNFDVYMRAGWKFVGVYYSYQVNRLFNEGKGPAITPMSIGISLSLF